MGCTSSAPNTVDSQTSQTENLGNHLISTEDSKDQTNENENTNGQQELEQRQVLPKTFINETQVARNISVPVPDKNKVDNMDTKDIQDNDPTENNVNAIDDLDSSEVEENLLSLKDVVEKVILDNSVTDKSQVSNVKEIQNTNSDNYIEETNMGTKDSKGDDEINSDDDNEKVSSSPTQSEDSRATRWEALADIAAELPPSLAVDPLTGQIYSLTK